MQKVISVATPSVEGSSRNSSPVGEVVVTNLLAVASLLPVMEQKNHGRERRKMTRDENKTVLRNIQPRKRILAQPPLP